jgi:hypothetical protein
VIAKIANAMLTMIYPPINRLMISFFMQRIADDE